MIYKLKTDRISDNWIVLPNNLLPFKAEMACMNSNFEILSSIYKKNDIIKISTSEDIGGFEFPDVFYDDSVLLVSEITYKILKRINTPFFERKVIIHDNVLNDNKNYYLIVPPRIDAIEGDKIKDNKVSKYDIFKIEGYYDNEIYISERLMRLMSNLKGILFIPINTFKCYEHCYDKKEIYKEAFIEGYYDALLEINE